MKKMLAGLTAAVLLGGMLSVPVSAAETPAYELGDVDMNGKVDLLDAIEVLIEANYRIMDDTYLTKEQMILADTDENGDITIQDAALIMYYYNATVLMAAPVEETGKNIAEFRESGWYWGLE